MNGLKITKRLTILLITLTFLVSALSSCGGSSSSGGSDFFGAGFVSISAQPNQIDTGNRTKITTFISDTHKDGVLLKFRMPLALFYVPGTARLRVDNNEKTLTPDVNIETADEIFMVYFLEQKDFGMNNVGKLTFELRGNEILSKGRVEVDLDVNDKFIEDEVEFDPENPEFTATDWVEITVIE